MQRIHLPVMLVKNTNIGNALMQRNQLAVMSVKNTDIGKSAPDIAENSFRGRIALPIAALSARPRLSSPVFSKFRLRYALFSYLSYKPEGTEYSHGFPLSS